jgi:hypothetical protein
MLNRVVTEGEERTSQGGLPSHLSAISCWTSFPDEGLWIVPASALSRDSYPPSLQR